MGDFTSNESPPPPQTPPPPRSTDPHVPAHPPGAAKLNASMANQASSQGRSRAISYREFRIAEDVGPNRRSSGLGTMLFLRFPPTESPAKGARLWNRRIANPVAPGEYFFRHHAVL